MMSRSLTRSFLALVPFAALALAGACGGTSNETTSGDPPSSGGSGPAGTGGSSTTSTGGTGGTGGMEPPPPMRRTIVGDATWTVTFDDTAKAAGATDCAYTRHYQGVEDASAPWLCPTCEILFRADVTMTAGLDDCFPQVSSGAPAKVEWIGYANGTWWRGTGGPTSENGTVTLDKDAITLVNQVTDLDAAVGGKMQFDVAGTFTLADEEGDRMNGWVPPATYACGWPKATPEAPPYTGGYTIVKGQELPDGLFHDKCNEVVRLHDLKGAYMVVDMAAIDCPPCQNMASGAEQFVADMKAQGIDVRMVTLLAPSLADPFGTTSQTKLNGWTTKYNLTSPVLADRSWGLSMFIPIFGDQVGYPSWVIVDPNLTVLEYGNGFGDYTEFEQVILADAQ